MKLKFCGCRRMEDVIYCNELLPDYLGVILSSGFRRTVVPETAHRLVQAKDPRIASVGVFVDAPPEQILSVLRQVPLDVIQLHGHETREVVQEVRRATGLPVWKAVRVQSAAEIRAAETLGADMLVLEGYVAGQVGGTGVTANWQCLVEANPQVPFWLAGGLAPENIQRAMATVQPHGIDISSGIETDGVKDFQKMKQIVDVIRGGYYG